MRLCVASDLRPGTRASDGGVRFLENRVLETGERESRRVPETWNTTKHGHQIIHFNSQARASRAEVSVNWAKTYSSTCT
eukprot:1905140-Prymnesium_polylepis.1